MTEKVGELRFFKEKKLEAWKEQMEAGRKERVRKRQGLGCAACIVDKWPSARGYPVFVDGDGLC